MDISLTSDLAEFVNRKVASGVYSSASDVVRDGLQLLRERDEQSEQRLEQLRRDIALGAEQADQGRLRTFNEAVIEGVKK